MLYWEVGICHPKGTNESVFECLDSALQGVEVVVVWLNELEANVLWLKVSIDDICCLVVHHIDLWPVAFAHQIFEILSVHF